MGSLPDLLQPHLIQMKVKTGNAGAGPVYSGPVEVKCRVEDKIRLVRDANGQQVVSSTTIYTSHPADWRPGNQVTVNGRETTVISVSNRDDGDFGSWQHVEVALV